MKLKIFIIEDEADIINLYRLVFEKNDMELESASTGNEGLEKLKGFAEGKTSKPDMILLDLLLPDISGIKVLKEVKKIDELKNIPIIVLSNYNKGQIPNPEKDDERELEDTDYLVKIEYTPQQLVDYIKKKINSK